MGRRTLVAVAVFGVVQPLEIVAHHIRVHLGEARSCQFDADYHRVAAGVLLLKARERIDGGWEAWCKVHVPRSQRDIRKCIALASKPDPQAAIGAEREAAREGMRRIRRGRSNVRPLPALVTHARPVVADGHNGIDEIDEILGRIARLREGQRARLFTKLREEYEL